MKQEFFCVPSSDQLNKSFSNHPTAMTAVSARLHETAIKPALRQTHFQAEHFPSFLHNRMSQFYDRWQKEWQGQHIMQSLPANPKSILLNGNDYLQIASLPALNRTTVSQQGLMSAVFLSQQHGQYKLQQRFAEFLQADETVLCQSGYNANVGLIQALAEHASVPIYIDSMAHMSIWDGCRYAPTAPVHRFKHNQVHHLSELIDQHGAGIVVVDSVYSTNGSLCPLQTLVPMAYDKGCTLIVDESHSLGTHGPSGAGLVVELGLTSQVMFRTASLAKAFAGRAGLITCPKGFADFFQSASSAAIFSSSCLDMDIERLDAALTEVIQSDGKRDCLQQTSQHIREALLALDYDVRDSQSQIIALEAGEEYRTQRLARELEACNVFGAVFCAPATPKHRSLVRLSLHADLSEWQAAVVIHACQKIRQTVQHHQWASTQRLLADRQQQTPACTPVSMPVIIRQPGYQDSVGKADCVHP